MEIRARKLEELAVIVVTELDENLEEKLKEKFKEIGPSFQDYENWRTCALEDGTIKKELGINGSDITKITRKISRVETEKILVSFPVDVTYINS